MLIPHMRVEVLYGIGMLSTYEHLKALEIAEAVVSVFKSEPTYFSSLASSAFPRPSLFR
jgi:hypothetical protein